MRTASVAGMRYLDGEWNFAHTLLLRVGGGVMFCFALCIVEFRSV